MWPGETARGHNPGSLGWAHALERAKLPRTALVRGSAGFFQLRQEPGFKPISVEIADSYGTEVEFPPHGTPPRLRAFAPALGEKFW